MKSFLLVLISVLLFTATPAQPKVVYTCVMHPQVQQAAPGNCPICGMTLVKKTIRTAAPKAAPRKTVEKPRLKPAPARRPPPARTQPAPRPQPVPKVQPQPAQKPVEKPAAPAEPPGAEARRVETYYTCVMHPQVHKDKPGTCPICGMPLVKKTVAAPAPPPAAAKGRELTPKAGAEANDTAAFVPTGATVSLLPGKTVVYHLYVRDTVVNYTGKQKHAYAINGSIPAPTLEFTEGDTAEIYLHNELKNEQTSLHWHGVILPNRFDGVPFLTTAPISPGETHLYKFRVVQNGTYWYHSHTALQEQQGMYGALLFKPRAGVPMSTTALAGLDSASTTHYNVVLSEWADENPAQTQRRLRTGNDWFSIKKGSTQSYGEAIKEGHFRTKLVNEWKRMKAMDVSDDYYERFLVNGRPQVSVSRLKGGSKVLLHVVNAGASTYFWLQYAGGKITVVGNDGNDLVPVEVDRLIIAPAETYDLLVTIPDNMSYEFRATSEDRTGASSLWLGSGMQMPAPKLPRLNYFAGMKMMNAMMNTNGTMKSMDMNMSLQQMDMNTVMYPEVTGERKENDNEEHSTMGHDHPEQQTNPTGHQGHAMAGMENMPPSSGDIVTLNYGMMRAPVSTALSEGPMKVLRFSLTGNMNRYVWTLDNKTVNEADRIPIQKGENLRIILTNNSMMRHPMHLHGHDFRVVNPAGDYAPLKNVIDILPMETDTIEVAANQEGSWFFHCHILYHMMAGMGRVFTYQDSPPNPELPNAEEAYRMFLKHNNMYHLMARVGLESNGSDGEAVVSTNRYALQGLWHLGLKPEHGYEGELNFGRYLGVNQWLFPYVGFDYHYQKVKAGDGKATAEKTLLGQRSNKRDRKTVVAGVQYTLPWLVLADGRIDGDGKLRFQLSREDIPLTARLRLNFMGNTDKEYAAGLRYVVSKWLVLSTHYDSDMGPGAGITITY